MFIGEYSYSLDDKGRVAIPTKFRAALADGLVITRGLDGCLFIYSKKAWEKFVEKISTMPFSKQNARAFARLMMAGAMDLVPDRQGRVVIPGYLRDYAKLKKEVVLAGVLERLELWDAKSWNEYKKKTDSEASNIAENLEL
jgi:MraZ protein